MSDLVLVALIAAAPAMLSVFLAVNKRSINRLEKRVDKLDQKVQLILNLVSPNGEHN